METREIFCLAALILNANKTVLTRASCNREKGDNTSFDNKIKDPEDKKGIVSLNRGELGYFMGKCRETDRMNLLLR